HRPRPWHLRPRRPPLRVPAVRRAPRPHLADRRRRPSLSQRRDRRRLLALTALIAFRRSLASLVGTSAFLAGRPELPASLGLGYPRGGRSLKRWILPVAVLGSSRTSSTQRGYLKGARRVLTKPLSSSPSASLPEAGSRRTTKALGLVRPS